MKLIKNSFKDIATFGPYSPSVEVEGDGLRILYTAGQGTYDPSTGKEFLGDIPRQTELAMQNLKRVIEASGYKMKNIVKVTLYLTSSSDRSKVNEIYKKYFDGECYPARSTVGVKDLPGGKSIEIEAIAYKSIK